MLKLIRKRNIPLVGAELQDHHIILALYDADRNALQLMHKEERNPDGRLRDQLRQLAQRFRLQHCQWNVVLNSSQHQLMLVDVPDVPEEEINGALTLRAGELVATPLEDLTTAIIRLPDEAYHGRLKMAFVATADSSLTGQISHEFGLAGLRLSAIDAEPHALRNLAALSSQKPATGVLRIEPSTSSIILCYRQHICLCRTLEVGLADMLAGDDSSIGNQIQLESMILEIQRSLDYFESQLGLGQITDLLIVADNSLDDQIISRLDGAFHARVRRFRITGYMDAGCPLIHDGMLALGGSLRQLEHNL